MFEINEITYYKTQDGESFETYEEAEEHNNALIEKGVPFDEFSMYNVYGMPVPVDEYDYIYFVYAKTDNGARFLERFIREHISLEEDTKIEPKILYRYDNDEKRWISQEEDLDRFNNYWGNLITFKEARC